VKEIQVASKPPVRSMEFFFHLMRIEDINGALKFVTICSFSSFLALLLMLMMLLDNSWCWKGNIQIGGI